MRCPKCGLENPPRAEWCDCGYNFSTGRVSASKTQPTSNSGNGTVAEYFSFEKMVTPTIIKLVYVIGAAGLTIAGGLMIATNTKDTNVNSLGAASGLLLATVGNLVWRILCEHSILYFRMHEALTSINDSSWRK
jgi:hypothetical protein